MSMPPGIGQTASTGASLTSRNTPALTIVEEWSSALVGVGATMAPSSQVWNGICAALVIPANAKAVTASTAICGTSCPIAKNSASESVPMVSTQTNRPIKNEMPPSRFMMI